MRDSKYVSLLAFIIVTVLLMTFQSRVGPLRPFGFLRTGVDALNGYARSAIASVKRTVSVATLREEENMRLRRRISDITFDTVRLAELERENNRLRKLLSLSRDMADTLTGARVVGRGGGRWTEALVIDKGSKDGVMKDMAVVTEAGLVGKVADVRSGYSLVLLITDSTFSAAVRLEKSRHEAILSGTGTQRLALKFVPSNLDVVEGEDVITSGLDALFPRGIKAATVSSIRKSEGAMFLDIDAVPAVDPHTVEEVLVLKSAGQDGGSWKSSFRPRRMKEMR